MKRPIVGLACALAVASIAVQSCASPGSLGRGFDEDAGAGGGSSFTPPDGGGATTPDGASPVLACIGTDCPSPWATCVSNDGPSYKCGTDLLRDPNHCGACGNECVQYEPIHMTSRCLDGACQPECYTKPELFTVEEWRNCDGLLDNGCEVDVLNDVNHCGACGNACPPGAPCREGKCGCAAGFVLCSGRCVDPLTDDFNCGACGNECAPPAGACMQPNTRYGCSAGKCEKMCRENHADCNGDLGLQDCGGDGCEVSGLNTKQNCGGCGIKCTKPGEECIDEGNGLECAVRCERFGLTLCGQRCVDLLSDVDSCGACNAPCPAAGPNQIRTCSKGVCAYECALGFGDCNGSSADGCETNLMIHAGNCGACGNACNAALGQPCIEGACLMTECEEGETN